jgi:HD superfamily phosphohydrolase
VPAWEPDQLADFLAHLIIGGTSAPMRPFLNEVVSGAMDADKLDYMPRDCYMAGLPMPVDVDRLLEKVHVLSLPASALPDYAERFSLAPDQPIQLLVVEPSGGRTVEELVVSRVLLYEKLYHHQKVRAFEGMVENALDLLVSVDPAFRRPSTYLRLSDEDFLRLHWPDFLGDGNARQMHGVARQLLQSVARRQSLFRALAFGPSMIETPPPDSEEGRTAWGSLQPNVDASDQLKHRPFAKGCLNAPVFT